MTNFRAILLASLLGSSLVASSNAAEVTVELGAVGSGVAFSTMQPSLVMTPIVRLQGEIGEIGEVKWFGGNFAPRGWAKAHGQLLSIDSNNALYSKLGTIYGGDGRTTFALPDLRGRAAIGTGQTPGGSNYRLGQTAGSETVALTTEQMAAHAHDTDDGVSSSAGGSAPFNNVQPVLALDYEIMQYGAFPSRSLQASSQETIEGILGFLRIDAANDGAGGTTIWAAGSLQPIEQNNALFSVLGTMYGGDGRTTFALPDTRGRLVVSAGNGPGLVGRSLGAMVGNETTTMSSDQLPEHMHSDPDYGQTSPEGNSQSIDNRQPELALNYIIATVGTFPSRNLVSNVGFVEPSPVEPIFQSLGLDPFLGEISLFAGNFAPRGWALAHGQLMPISQYSALFSILGTTFGGDGRTTFGLPDLRGRTPIGDGNSYRIGQTLGDDNFVLNVANLPQHTHSVERMAPIPLPAPALPLVSALAGLWLLRRRSAKT